jgi:hypothetical protein
MSRELFDHVVKEADPGGNIISPGPVEVHFDQDVGFGSLSGDPSGTHRPRYTREVGGRNRLAGGQTAHAQHCRLTAKRAAATYEGMSEPPLDSLIPYDEIVQEALRAVVGRVLGAVERGGSVLPGTHHFYITFKTHAPGVSIPQHLRERFPDEMTIVLQNKFWDLKVDEDGFGVGLTFNQIPAKLSIPFAAITAFVDPAVDFGLQFQAAVTDIEPAAHEQAENDTPEGDAEQGAAPGVANPDDGSNVVTVDFNRKK